MSERDTSAAVTRPFVLGIDIGGTSTRALVIDGDGARLGSGRAGGANLTSHALDAALDAVTSAVGQALDGLDPTRVGAAVIGTAGIAHVRVPAVAAALDQRWRKLSLTCGYDVYADALIAFVAGTAQPAGTLVLSGTGSLAARVENRQLAHIVDAHGWLLGDLGSGFWLGRAAVRAVLTALDHQTAFGPLTQAVTQTLLGASAPVGRQLADELVLRVHGKPPVALAALAPLVCEYAGLDPEADRILAEAAGHLFAAGSTVREPQDTTPIVVAGSLLTADTPLARLVRDGVAQRWPTAVVSTARDAAAGAAWLAAVTAYSLDDDAATALHACLLDG